MPLQNRVTPFGDIVAVSQRGMFTGNRGIIHDPSTQTLLNRRWTTKTWLICSYAYKGRRREVMSGRTWTELFFLDEAVALAAGHRPCFLCRRQAALSFRECWATAHGVHKPSATTLDATLHQERLDRGHSQHPLDQAPGTLPDGTMVAQGGTAFLVIGGLAYPWTIDGYASPQSLGYADAVLTPPSTVATLRAGYRPVLHPTIGIPFDRTRDA